MAVLTVFCSRVHTFIVTRDDRGSITVEKAIITVAAAAMAAAAIGIIAAAVTGKLSGFSI